MSQQLVSTPSKKRRPTEGAHPRPQALAVRRGHRERDRVEGSRVRATAQLCLQTDPACNTTELARRLRNRLNLIGVKYHARTIKRQLSGTIDTVPRQVADALDAMACETLGLSDDADLRRALAAADLVVDPTPPRYVPSSRVRPLCELWLFLNPAASKRQLATAISATLLDAGITIGVDSLQIALAGKQNRVLRQVVEALVDLLRAHSIDGEEDALARRRALESDIVRRTRRLALVSPEELLDLVSAWKQLHHEPSSRRLAELLRVRLVRAGIEITLHRAQDIIDGRTKRVRQACIEVMHELLEEATEGGAPVDEVVARARRQSKRLLDHCWVRAASVAELANEWQSRHPTCTQRQLAIRVMDTTRRMGFSIGLSTVQPILGGHKKRCRGYVYRALLRQFDDRADSIPRADILASTWSTRALRRGAQPRNELKSNSPVKRSEARQGNYLMPARRRLERDEELALAQHIAAAEQEILRVIVADPRGRGELAKVLDRLEAGEMAAWDVVADGGSPASPQHQARARRRVLRALGPVTRRGGGELPTAPDGIRLEQRLLRSLSRRAARNAELSARLNALWKRRDDAQAKLIDANMTIVRAVVAKYHPGGMLEHHDLMQEGCMGMMRAVDKYDVTRGVRFSTYANYWVRQAVQKAISNRSRSIRLPSHIIQDRGRMKTAARSFEARAGRRPTAAELTRLTGIAESKIGLLTALPSEPLSFSAPLHDSAEMTIGDRLTDPTDRSAVDDVAAAELRDKLRGLVDELPSREAWVIRQHFGIACGPPRTLASLGGALGVTRERVRQIKENGLAAIRAKHPALLDELASGRSPQSM